MIFSRTPHKTMPVKATTNRVTNVHSVDYSGACMLWRFSLLLNLWPSWRLQSASRLT